MFLKLRPLLHSLLFLGGLELCVFKPNFAYYILLVLILAALYSGKRIGHRWRFSILPVLFSLSAVALLQLISIFFEEQIFIALATIINYFCLFGMYRLSIYKGDQTAKGMIMAATSATIFFAYTAAYGIYLNFLVPLYALMLVYCLVTLFLSYQYFSIIETSSRKVWIYSFLLALLVSEVIWTMNFWPFGYLTTGVIALILYYVLWDLVQSYFLNLLSRKRVVANMVFFSSMIVLVLLSSKWIPVI